jgi:hypothetical protein
MHKQPYPRDSAATVEEPREVTLEPKTLHRRREQEFAWSQLDLASRANVNPLVVWIASTAIQIHATRDRSEKSSVKVESDTKRAYVIVSNG